MSDMQLTDARKLVGLSQTGLDESAGLPKGSTHDLETGRNKRPSHEAVTKIVRALRRAGLHRLEAEQLFPVSDDSHETASSADRSVAR